MNSIGNFKFNTFLNAHSTFKAPECQNLFELNERREKRALLYFKNELFVLIYFLFFPKLSAFPYQAWAFVVAPTNVFVGEASTTPTSNRC